MINTIILGSIKHRALVLFISGLVFIAGVIALKNTAVDAIPDLSDVQVIVKTPFAGQAPQVVEDQVTHPLSSALLSVPKATTVRGYSFFGDSYVYVIFEDGTDLYWARARVLEYLSQISSKLPDSAKPELGPDATGVGWIYQYALVDRSGQKNLSELRSLQDWFLKFELQSTPGVAEIATVGGMVKQYQIVVDPHRLRAYNMPIGHIQTAIKQANQEVGASVIEIAEAEYMVRSNGYLQSVDDINNIPLGLNQQGSALLLGDIAEVSEGPQMRRAVTDLNGKGEAVGGIVVMRSGANARVTITAIKEKLTELQKSLPPGVEVIEVYDRSLLIDRAVDHLQSKLIYEFFAVSIICALFLFHLRSSLVVLISLPIGLATAFLIMYWQGINANIMSLSGIALAVGTMVAGAIVMIENVHKHFQKQTITDDNRWQVIGKACTEVGSPLFFSLMVITVSFLPVFALQAQEGKMFAPLAYTKTYAMAVSAGLALTLVPVLLGYFVRGNIAKLHQNPINRYLLAIYKPLLSASLQHPKTVIAIALVSVALGIYPLSKIGNEFMPPLDEGDLLYMPTTYAAISVGKARQVLQQTNQLIKQIPEVKTVYGKAGRADTATDTAPLTMIETIIQFHPKSQWREGMSNEKLRDELEQQVQLPGLSNAWVMPIKNRIDMQSTGIKTPIGIKIAGPDLITIENIGRDIEKILSDVDGTISVYSEQVFGGRYVQIDIDRQRAAGYGLSIDDVQQWIQTAIGGINVTTTIEGQQRFPVNLRYPQRYRDSADQLKLLPIITANGTHLVLADVANISIKDGPAAIKTENARLHGWTLIDIENRDIGGYVEQAKTLLSENLKLPPGYSINWSGQYQAMQRLEERLRMVIPITALVIIFLLFAHFRRLQEVVLIIGTLPFAILGGILFIYFSGFNFSVAVTVGFVALAGLAVEINILMLSYLNQHQRQQQPYADEQSLKNAIIDAACARLRPIVMTVLSVIIGLIAAMSGDGTGASVMQRIAGPMVGGLLTTLLLALWLIPTIYLLWQRQRINKNSLL